MNLFRKKKKKLKNELTWDQMVQRYNEALFEREELHRKMMSEALELDKKRDKTAYLR